MLQKLKSDTLLRHNLVYFVGSMAVAVLNYLYYPALGRMLRVDEFGEITALFSLTAQIGVVLGVFSLVAIHLSANSEHKGGRNVLQDIYAIVFWVQILALAFLIIGAPYLKSALQFPSMIPFFLLAINAYIGLPSALLTSVLQSKKEFPKLSIGGVMQAGGKLLFAVILVSLGAGVMGAIGALIMSQILVLWYYSGNKWSQVSFFPKVKPLFDRALKSELRYAVLVFVATSTIAFLSVSDTFVMKYFFPPDVAGEYSGISVIARILFFATASITAVLLPSITLAQTPSENYRILGKSTLLVASIGGAGLLIMCLIPEFIIRAMLGAKYVTGAHLLPTVAFLMFLTSIINLLFVFCFALRKYVLLFIVFCGTLVFTYLTFRAHDTPLSLVHNFIITDLTMLVMLFAYLKYDYFHSQKTHLNNRSALQ